MRVGSHAPDPPLAQRWDRIGLGVRCAYNPRRPEVLQHCLQAGRRLSRLHPAQGRFIQRRMLDLLLHTVADDALPSLQTLPRPCAAFQETCMPCVNTDPFDADDLPCLDALIAGTVALMTAWADPCPQARLAPADLRCVLARKVVSNLFFLQHHPHAPPALRQSLALAHARWVVLAQPVPADGAVPAAARPQPLH